MPTEVPVLRVALYPHPQRSRAVHPTRLARGFEARLSPPLQPVGLGGAASKRPPALVHRVIRAARGCVEGAGGARDKAPVRRRTLSGPRESGLTLIASPASSP